ESQYSGYLSGRNLPLAGGLSQLLAPGVRTGNVRLTLSDYLQQAATFFLGQRVGAVVALDPRDGSVLALASQPSFDPNELASHNPTVESQAYNSLLKDPLNPMLPRVYRQSYAPRSTF